MTKQPPPLTDRAMDYIRLNAPVSIADVCGAISRGNSWKPAENAVAKLWTAQRIVVRDNVITIPET